jgi:hypothetical protein
MFGVMKFRNNLNTQTTQCVILPIEIIYKSEGIKMRDTRCKHTENRDTCSITNMRCNRVKNGNFAGCRDYISSDSLNDKEYFKTLVKNVPLKTRIEVKIDMQLQVEGIKDHYRIAKQLSNDIIDTYHKWKYESESD